MLQVGGREEVGRELLAHELVEGTVVILSVPGQPMTAQWVRTIATGYVAFHSYGPGKIIYVAFLRKPDGTLEYNSTQIGVFEYLFQSGSYPLESAPMATSSKRETALE
jgi:hypothetical protein